MFGIQTSELVVIALVAILLFGPERVPEFFHRAGQLISKLQRTADDLWTSLQSEMNEAKKPLEQMGKEIGRIGGALEIPTAPPSPEESPPEVGEAAEGPDDQDELDR